jgi:hypothetical protein
MPATPKSARTRIDVGFRPCPTRRGGLRTSLRLCVTTLMLTIAPPAAESTQYTVGAVDGGWYWNTGFHDPTNGNYIVGNTGWFGEPPASGVLFYRNFFVFDLPDTSEPSGDLVTDISQLNAIYS